MSKSLFVLHFLILNNKNFVNPSLDILEMARLEIKNVYINLIPSDGISLLVFRRSWTINVLLFSSFEQTLKTFRNSHFPGNFFLLELLQISDLSLYLFFL